MNKNKIPLSTSERNIIYMEIVTKLMEVEANNGGKKISLWELDTAEMKKFKVILNLYKDTGREFSGDIDFACIGRKLIYTLYNDRSKKTTAYLSEDKYFKSLEKKNKLVDKQTLEIK